MEYRYRNRFGRRFISAKDFLSYGEDLDLVPISPTTALLEFLEEQELLLPVVRLRFPEPIARRWHKERCPSETVPDPIEGDTPRYEAACTLREEVYSDLWRSPHIYGERSHALDDIAPEHQEFVQRNFARASFAPWKSFRAAIALRDGKELGDGGESIRTCYHYWQIFALAAILRSGVTILYDLGDESVFESLWRLDISQETRRRLRPTINLEARHGLNRINESAMLFEAIGYFTAYRQNARQKHVPDVDVNTRRFPYSVFRKIRRREKEIARETLKRFDLKPRHVLAFIRYQCELWEAAKKLSPDRVVDEYRRNIDSTVILYRLLTGMSFEKVATEVGRAERTEPILKAVFPDWIEEQRDLAARSLASWILPSMTAWPSPFDVTEADIDSFCAWIEKAGLLQLYWHFKRLLDLGFGDGDIARSATAAEAVSFANTVELMTNSILDGRGQLPRGHTFKGKFKNILSQPSPTLLSLLDEFWHLTSTRDSTLRLRLSQIERIKKGGALVPVLRTLLKLVVIRNEGSHLGLQGLDRRGIYRLLESLVQASIILWKVR